MTGILKVIQSVQTLGTSYPHTTKYKILISYLTESNMSLHSKYKITSAVQQNKCSGIWGPHSFTPNQYIWILKIIIVSSYNHMKYKATL